jgi:glycine cleavage system aminomethyltransferase T
MLQESGHITGAGTLYREKNAHFTILTSRMPQMRQMASLGKVDKHLTSLLVFAGCAELTGSLQCHDVVLSCLTIDISGGAQRRPLHAVVRRRLDFHSYVCD